MKKLFLAVLAGLMVMATASVAAAEVTVGGEIEVRYDLWDNLQLNRSTMTDNIFGNSRSNASTQSFFSQRVILNVDAKITEGLEAFVELDSAGTDTPWGANGAGAALGNGYLNHQDPALNIKQAWINFMVPGLPVGIKIGHQPLALGHGIFLDTHRMGSDAILVYSKPIPELLVAGAFIRGIEPAGIQIPGVGDTLAARFAQNNRKGDFYALLANYTFMENNTVGVNFTYIKDNNPAASVAAVDGRNSIWGTNAMLTLDGTMGPLSYRGEFDWLYQHVNAINGDKPYVAQGFAGMVGADFQAMPMLKVGMEVAYGTGNDNDDLFVIYNNSGGIAGNAGGLYHTRDHAYASPYNAGSYNYAFLYNDKIGQGPLGTGGGFGFGDGFGGFGLANTGYIKVSAKVNPMDKLSAGLDVLYLHASEQAVRGQSRDLGWEVDANASYKIYDNLTLDLKGGVFVPGAWYDFPGAATVLAGDTSVLKDGTDPNSGLKRDTAWGMETKLTVKF